MVDTTLLPSQPGLRDAQTWRDSLAAPDAAVVDELLLGRIACCDDHVRARVLQRLACALGAGVVDRATLHTIVDAVQAAA